MKIELNDEELESAVTALSHWRAYLISQGRDDSTVKAVLEKLRRTTKRVQ
jgi:hypothetical protein